MEPEKQDFPTNIEPKPIPEEKEQSFWDMIKFALLVLAVVIPIRLFIAQPFIVSGSSMSPTFDNGQYLIIDEISYRLEEPKRNDVIVFKYPNDLDKFFIKRIIGLPGETVEVLGDNIKIYNEENKSGFELSQPYIVNSSIDDNFYRLTLNDDEYFVMGDNRAASSDSRYWGALPKNLIIGKTFARLFPITKIGLWPGH